MAFNAGTQWDVRTTGSDSNGGGFAYGLGAKTVSAATDLAVDASNPSKVTSATHNFVSGDINKYVNVTSGTNWVVGYYQILSVSSNAAILDQVPGALSATSGHYDLYAAIDYSQQDSPQITYTDMVIDATTNTKFTSAGNPVTDSHVGNIVNVTSGTGFTVQRVQILSQSSGVATCDKSLGTLSSTGGNGKLGGGLLTIGTANGLIVASGTNLNNNIHVKAGTYTLTVGIDLTAQNFGILGYGSNHYDGGTKPLITTATNSVKLFKVEGTWYRFYNLSLSNTAGTRADLVWSGSAASILEVQNCVLNGGVVGINGDNGVGYPITKLSVSGTEIKNCSSHGIINFYDTYVAGCYIHGNSGDGIQNNSGSRTLNVVRSIIDRNNKGITNSSAGTRFSVVSCDISNSTSDGIVVLGGGSGTFLDLENNIIYGNGGYGVNGGSALIYMMANRNNYYGSNTSGLRTGTGAIGPLAGIGDGFLTADPFTSSATGDFTLNSTAGGGTACKGAGYQWS